LSAAGARVHRISASMHGDAIALEVPHRQTNYEIADLASQRHGHWLAGPGGLGLVVREMPDTELQSLEAAAARLISSLHNFDRNAAFAADGTVADIIVAAVDELSNAALRAIASCARQGVIVLCRRDLRQLPRTSDRSLPADVIAARALGWQIRRTCGEGIVLERNGKAAAVVDEPAALTGSEDLVTDVVDRLSHLGWRPLVAWRDAPRDPSYLAKLLDARAIPLARDDPFRAVVKRLDLSPTSSWHENTHHINDVERHEASHRPLGDFESEGLIKAEPTERTTLSGSDEDSRTAEVAQSADKVTIAGASSQQTREAGSSARILSIAVSSADDRKVQSAGAPRSLSPRPNSDIGITKRLQQT
jgi:hypothetical protein